MTKELESVVDVVLLLSCVCESFNLFSLSPFTQDQKQRIPDTDKSKDLPQSKNYFKKLLIVANNQKRNVDCPIQTVVKEAPPAPVEEPQTTLPIVDDHEPVVDEPVKPEGELKLDLEPVETPVEPEQEEDVVDDEDLAEDDHQSGENLAKSLS